METIKKLFQTKLQVQSKMLNTVEILKDCRYYLQKLELCNKNGPIFGKISIPSAVIQFACVFPMSLTVVFMMRFIVISGFNLDTICSTFAISIGVSQMSFIYITLAVNRRLILKTMDQMQHLVDYRKNKIENQNLFIQLYRKIYLMIKDFDYAFGFS